MHRPYRVNYRVKVAEKGEEPRWEPRVAYISARNPANAEKRLIARTMGVEREVSWPVKA